MTDEDRAYMISKLESDLDRTSDAKAVYNGKQKIENEHGAVYQALVRLGARLQIKKKYRGK